MGRRPRPAPPTWSSEQGAFMIEVLPIKGGDGHKTIVIVKNHASLLERDEAFLAQFAQHAIDMDGA